MKINGFEYRNKIQNKDKGVIAQQLSVAPELVDNNDKYKGANINLIPMLIGELSINKRRLITKEKIKNRKIEKFLFL